MKTTLERIKNGNSLKIVALGDSLTYGWMVKKGYIDFFREMFQKKFPNIPLSIINDGIPGSTALDGLSRLKLDLINKNPNLFFIQFALNDAFTGYTPDDFYSNMMKIVKTIKNNTEAEILILTSAALNTNEDHYIEKFYDKLEQISISEGTGLVKVHSYWNKKINDGVDFNNLVQDDRVHPTEEGYLLMAEAIMGAFSF